MQYVTIFLTLLVFSLSACSNKTTPNPVLSKVKISIEDMTPSKDVLNSKEKSPENDQTFSEEFETEFSTEESTNTIDPLRGYNRSMTNFNDKIITYALNPVSEAYAYVIPEPLRIGLSNFIKNINFPVRLTNNLLQGKLQNVSDEVARFIINSTVGLAGIMDPAQIYMHIPAHKEDFGQTLGYYDVGKGFHIVLPFLGPSNLRDVVGITFDSFISPWVNVRGLENYKIPRNFWESTGIVALHMINNSSLNLGQYESIKKDAIDLYPFLRDIYEQKRISEINE